MITAANADDYNLPFVLEYELTTPPPSLFEPSRLMREAHKSKLSDSMRDLFKDDPPSKDEYNDMVTILIGRGFTSSQNPLEEERALFRNL